MNLRHLISTLLSVLCGSFLTAAEKPNIVFILADDLGGHDLGCYGSTFHETPHLDALARRGMLFRNAYSASPLCSPTRAGILTGLHPARIGITAPNCHLPPVQLEKRLASGRERVLNADSITRLKTDYLTIAEVLRDAGWRTGHLGKWHLGREPYSPLEHGFESDLPHTPGPGPGGGNGYFAPWQFWSGVGQPGDHIEDRMALEAEKFIADNKERPFFLNYWAFSVHSPWMAKEEYTTEAAKRAAPDAPQRNPIYAGMMRSLDDAVGRIVASLEKHGLAEKTLIIFTSDNGGWHNVAKEATKNARFANVPVTSNAPFRSGKASNYEGGTHVPLLAVWPGKIAPGTTSDAIVQSTDFFPTLLDLAKLPRPAELKLDGISIAPALRGESLKRDAIFSHFPHGGRSDIDGFRPATWVRRGDWKLIRFFSANEDGSDQLELYNLRDDISETKNLAAAQADLVREVNTLITGFLRDTEAVVPKLNPNFKATPAAPAAQSGWLTSKDAQLRIENGKMKITSTGGDPWISTRDLPANAKGPFTLKLGMSSTAGGNGVVYFTDKARGGFHKEQTVSFPLQHDGQPHDHVVRLPVETLTALRLDPGNAKGEIVITSLTLHDSSGALIKACLNHKP